MRGVVRIGMALVVLLGAGAVGPAWCDDVDGDGQSRAAGDCDDGEAGAHSGAAESCNGRDDDCDGSLDEGCGGSCGAFGAETEWVELDRDGSYDGAVSASRSARVTLVTSALRGGGAVTGLWLRSVGLRGTVLRTRLVDAAPRVGARSRVAARGDGGEVVWVRDEGAGGRCYARAYDAELTPVAAEAALSAASVGCFAPDVSWSGMVFGEVWVETQASGDRLWFGTRRPDGTVLGGPVPLSATGARIEDAALAWGNGAFGVVWVERQGGTWVLEQMEISETAVPSGPARPVATSGERLGGVALAWIGSRYVVGWEQVSGGVSEVVLAELLGDGTVVSGPVVASAEDGLDSTAPSLIWTGERSVVGWLEPGAVPPHVELRSYGAGLVASGGPVVVTAAEGVRAVSLAWTGTHVQGVHRVGAGSRLSMSLTACVDGDGDQSALGVGDCQDGEATIHRGAVETCEGTDQDCNLYPDDGCGFGTCPTPQKQPAIPVMDAQTSGAWLFDIAWAGDRFGVTWQESRVNANNQIFFQLFDHSGMPLSSEITLTDSTYDARRPQCVWTGKEFAVVWKDQRDYSTVWGGEVYFQRIGRDGVPIGPQRNVSEIGIEGEVGIGAVPSPTVAWSGTQFLVAWSDHRDDVGRYRLREIYTRVLDAEGRPAGPPQRLTDFAGSAKAPHLAWNGEEYGLAFEVSDTVYFARVGTDGRLAAPPVLIDAELARNPRLAWMGDRYAIAYAVTSSRHLRVGVIDRAGSALAPFQDMGATTAWRQRIAWAGEEFGIAFYDDVLPAGAVRVTRFDLNAAILGNYDVWRSSDGTTWNTVGFAWTGREYATLYAYEPPSGTYEDYLSYLTCCRDLDGDGVTLCSDCDDADPTRYPGALEVCDAVDNDCDGTIDNGAGAPGAVPGLGIGADHETVSWPALSGADSYDLLRGDVRTLEATGGSFADAVESCLASSQPGTTYRDPQRPVAGESWFYLVRARGCGDQAGTYDTNDAGLSGSRDPGIAASPNACP